jgi:hypothetical protein
LSLGILLVVSPKNGLNGRNSVEAAVSEFKQAGAEGVPLPAAQRNSLRRKTEV